MAVFPSAEGSRMDWELNERYHATALLTGVVLLCICLLLFQKSMFVKHLRSMLQMAGAPTHRLVGGMQSAVPISPVNPVSNEDMPGWAISTDLGRRLQQLEHENARLREIAGLKESRWPRAVVATITGRDPMRWFQEVVIDRGARDGIVPDCAVVAVVEGREGLIGRVVEVMDQTSKVALIQDSLSAIAARRPGTAFEEGVVEGTNSHELVLKYLDRSSPVKIGDPIVTAGLGGMIPPEIPIGWVDDIQLDPRQLFLQARLRPAVPSNRVSVVLILVPKT